MQCALHLDFTISVAQKCAFFKTYAKKSGMKLSSSNKGIEKKDVVAFDLSFIFQETKVFLLPFHEKNHFSAKNEIFLDVIFGPYRELSSITSTPRS